MKKITLITLFLLSIYSRSFCQDIYTYVAASTAGAPSYVDPNLATASNLTAIGTGSTTPCAQGFSGITGFTGTSYSTSGACIQISLTAAAGYTITATGFTTHLRNSVTGPVKARLAYSSDGGATWIDDGTDYIPFSGSCATSTAGTNLASWMPFSVTNASLLFRVYPYAAPGSGGTIQIFDLDIIGNVHVMCTPPPSITVSAAMSNICSGGAGAALTASGAGIGGTYIWSPSAGLSAAVGAAVTATPVASVVYTITGTTAAGCSNTVITIVNVNPVPVIAVVSSASTVCNGTGAPLSASGAGVGGSYSWAPATALSSTSGAMVTASPSSLTIYTVTGTTSFGCAHTAIATVSVNPLPAAPISITGPTTFCPGDTTVLGTGLGAGYTFKWYNGSSLIFGATSNLYGSTSSGSYKAVVTNGFGCSATSAPVTITVAPLPVASITASGAASFCLGGSVLLTAAAGGYSYQWYDGSTAIPGATNLSYVAGGTGSIKVKVTSAFGCINMSPAISTTAVPLPFLVAGGPVSFCAGANVTMAVNTGGATSGITYQWGRGGAILAGATTSIYTATLTGDYKCIVNVGGTCIDTTMAEHVVVHPAPAPVVSFNGVLLSTSNSYTSYQWYVNTLSIPGAVSYFTIPISSIHNGSYTVSVMDANGCSAMSGAFSMGGGTHPGLAVGNVGNTGIRIYPNPAIAITHIESPAPVNAVITAVDGKIILQQRNAQDIDISSLASGLYLITLYDDNGERLTVQKLVKE